MSGYWALLDHGCVGTIFPFSVLSHAPTPAPSFTHTHPTHSTICTLAHAHSLSHMHTQALAHSQYSHTLTPKHVHTLMHTHMYTHTQKCALTHRPFHVSRLYKDLERWSELTLKMQTDHSPDFKSLDISGWRLVQPPQLHTSSLLPPAPALGSFKKPTLL